MYEYLIFLLKKQNTKFFKWSQSGLVCISVQRLIDQEIDFQMEF